MLPIALSVDRAVVSTTRPRDLRRFQDGARVSGTSIGRLTGGVKLAPGAPVARHLTTTAGRHYDVNRDSSGSCRW